MRIGRIDWIGAGAGLLVLFAMPNAVRAQAAMCGLPADLPTSHAEGPTAREPRRVLPIGGYTLALAWSPEYCHRRRDSPADAIQCGGTNRFGFTLHGLWPDGQGREWPQYCRAAAPVPPAVIRASLCATPSAQLIQHEWAKHGTCMAPDPARYFARSTALYRGLAFPDMTALSRRTLTAQALATAFARANSGIRADMVRTNVNRRGWLEELWICLGTDFRPRSCAAGQGGASPGQLVKIWRGGRSGGGRYRPDGPSSEPASGGPFPRSSRSPDDDDRGGGG